MIRELVDEGDVRRSYDVMRELRGNLSEDDYVAQVARQRGEGYRLAVVEDEKDGTMTAAAGFRIREMLFQGRHLYVDDLVTAETERSKGHGDALLTWLLQLAAHESCTALELDSGVQRARAHAFYFSQGMHIAAYHFALDLPGKDR